jgi:hypothetical protein
MKSVYDEEFLIAFFRPNCALLTMMKDQFANYVVQKVRQLFNTEDFKFKERVTRILNVD